jgi:probable rRNA maturation factor
MRNVVARSVYSPPWRVDVTIREGTPRLVAVSTLVRLIGAALAEASAPAPASVGLILSDDRELAELNERQLGHIGPTDVLSFPLLPPSAFPGHPGQGRSARAPEPHPPFALPPGRRLHLGDVVVSVERAIEQASLGRGGQLGRTRWSLGDELRLLVVHGTLHLCGWDHAELEEGTAMGALEHRLLDGTPRPPPDRAAG